MDHNIRKPFREDRRPRLVKLTNEALGDASSNPVVQSLLRAASENDLEYVLEKAGVLKPVMCTLITPQEYAKGCLKVLRDSLAEFKERSLPQ